MMSRSEFQTYGEWRRAITGIAGLELTRGYCQERRVALADESNPTTNDFIRTYGRDYLERVEGWFLQAEKEALS